MTQQEPQVIVKGMYRLRDTCGEPLRKRFSTWSAAHAYRCMMGRPNWTITKV